MIDLEERIQRYADELTADAPPVSVDDVIYGPTMRRAGHEPARLLMVAAVVGLAVAGGVVLLASRGDEFPDRTPIDAPATSAGTPTATVSPSTVPSTAPAGSGPPVQGTLATHTKFGEYVAAAAAVFGPVEIGASCEDWPDIPSEVTDQLVVQPAVTATSPCQVLGWSYRQIDGVMGLPESILNDGYYEPDAIYDEVGNVIGYLGE